MHYKWKYAVRHAMPSISGATRTVATNPGWGLRLLKARWHFFRTRGLRQPLLTPDNYLIESPSELIAYWSFFVEREGWAEGWMDELRKGAPPLILDVGANAGMFSHLIWTIRPDARIIAFEPLPKMAAKLKAWQARTKSNFTLHNAAAADKAGTATFYFSSENDPTSSLKTDGTTRQTLTVPVTTLDAEIPAEPILLIKIDVEGAEPEVLAGGKDTLKRARYLLIEAHTPEALAKIEQRLDTGWNRTQVGASDYLFSRS